MRVLTRVKKCKAYVYNHRITGWEIVWHHTAWAVTDVGEYMAEGNSRALLIADAKEIYNWRKTRQQGGGMTLSEAIALDEDNKEK